MICNTCKQDKDPSEFYKDSSRHTGYTSDCKECRKEKAQKWNEKHKDEFNKRRREKRKEKEFTYKGKYIPDEDGNIVCRDCGEKRQVDQFYFNADGYCLMPCKECRRVKCSAGS